MRKIATIFEKSAVEVLANKGVPDVEITKKLNISYNKVQKITTDYWNSKMKNRNEKMD